MSDADDMVRTDEDGRFAIGDAVCFQMGGARDHEELVAIHIDLRQLVRLERILDGQGMQSEIVLARLLNSMDDPPEHQGGRRYFGILSPPID